MRWAVEIVDEVDSTNRVLLERARDGAPAGSVLVADHQTAGRGRLDRSWSSPPGASLLVSVLLRPEGLDASRAHLLTFAAGLAAVDACRDVAGVDAGLKWPNDVVVDDLKLAGLLAEATSTDGRLDAVVVGMGLNLTWPEALPEGATSLAELAGRPIARADVLDAWLVSLACRLGDTQRVLQDYRRSSATIGRQVRVVLPGATVEGVASDVTDDGHLLVDGTAYAVGDVVHLRPA